jgi:hypothetical protein
LLISFGGYLGGKITLGEALVAIVPATIAYIAGETIVDKARAGYDEI